MKLLILTVVFEKLLFNVFFFFAFTGKPKAGVFISSGWKSVSKYLTFGDELLSTLGGLHNQMSYFLAFYVAENDPFPP